jgi:hypothetical protein
MHITLFEGHLDDVAVAVSGGDREARASTEPESESEVERDPRESATPDTVPRAALVLVPVFVAIGVAAGFLAARRLRRPRLPNGADAVDVEIATETGTGTEFH